MQILGSKGTYSTDARQTTTHRHDMGKRKVTQSEEAAQGEGTQPSDAMVRSQCVAFFNRTKEGFYKKASPSDRAEAAKAMSAYKQMGDADKLDFARKFLSNRGKGVGWVKNYLEEMTSRTKVKETVKEGYCNRTVNARTHAS